MRFTSMVAVWCLLAGVFTSAVASTVTLVSQDRRVDATAFATDGVIEHSDFQDAADALDAGGGIVRTDRAGLADVLADLLAAPERRANLGAAGRAVIRAHQGATARHVEHLLGHLPARS